MEERTGQDTLCYSPGSIAGAVIGTFLTTTLLLAVAAFFYRQWRRHKGKHLVLVTDPEIVEDAYAFDNPCFKDATIGGVMETRPVSVVETPVKEYNKWSNPWTALGVVTGHKHDKRRTLDDSCLGPKATRVSVVSLRSRDFTGLGFNVCGNMREGIFVKDLLHRGPASESGRIHPGDRITSVKISFRSMVYEDALTILSYASPYDVELEVESGGSGSRPTTLLKKSVGPSPTRICHPLYRSQSIPELSRGNKSSAKRLFIADPNESLNSNYSTMNSTIKSSKSTPGSQTLERKHEEAKTNNHHKFGIKVLPALDGTVHRIENQNEHNTNLERKHSKKLDYIEKNASVISSTPIATEKVTEKLRQRENRGKIPNGIDSPDHRATEPIVFPSEVPAEVHNAAMAARRNRKSSAELLNAPELEDKKSPQKNKRKAPAPPASPTKEPESIDTIADYAESLSDYVGKVREEEIKVVSSADRRNSESDTDEEEMQHSFTTIELNPSDITIHHTPVPRVDDEDDENDVYRKAASLGDLSKYEAKSPTTLERAQSLDMADAGLKKRKAPMPPEDIAEFTEDLTKLDEIETFDRRKLKKSSEWGTLEDAIWKKTDEEEEVPRIRKKSNGTLERSKSAVEIKLKEGHSTESNSREIQSGREIPEVESGRTSPDLEVTRITSKSEIECSVSRPVTTLEQNSPVSENNTTFPGRISITSEELSGLVANPDERNEDSIELYNLPLSKSMTLDFINSERNFNPDEDNSLARIVNNGRVVKSPTPEEVELDFRQAKPLAESPEPLPEDSESAETFEKALKFFDLHSRLPEKSHKPEVQVDLEKNGDNLYLGMKEVEEMPMKKVTVIRRCPGCDSGGHHDKHCELHVKKEDSPTISDIEKQIEPRPTEDEDVDDGCDLGVTINSKRVASPENLHNVSNISVSSGENSEDSGLVGESGEFNADGRPPLPTTPAPVQDNKKMTYITEIKVSPRVNPEVSEIHPKPPRNQVTITSNGKPTPGKKPPVPPRRNDSAKLNKESADKQVVYVSEFKSPEKNSTANQNKTEVEDDKSSSTKKFENWIYLGDNKEQTSWGGGSNQAQPVTNIVVSSGDEKNYK